MAALHCGLAAGIFLSPPIALSEPHVHSPIVAALAKSTTGICFGTVNGGGVIFDLITFAVCGNWKEGVERRGEEREAIKRGEERRGGEKENHRRTDRMQASACGVLCA